LTVLERNGLLGEQEPDGWTNLWIHRSEASFKFREEPSGARRFPLLHPPRNGTRLT
jgi:hypothetical protein